MDRGVKHLKKGRTRFFEILIFPWPNLTWLDFFDFFNKLYVIIFSALPLEMDW